MIDSIAQNLKRLFAKDEEFSSNNVFAPKGAFLVHFIALCDNSSLPTASVDVSISEVFGGAEKFWSFIDPHQNGQKRVKKGEIFSAAPSALRNFFRGACFNVKERYMHIRNRTCTEKYIYQIAFHLNIPKVLALNYIGTEAYLYRVVFCVNRPNI